MRYDQIDCFNHNSFNSSPFWMIYGFFLSENLCGSPVRAAQVWVQVQPAIPAGYPCHSLCSVLTWPCALPTVPGAQIPCLQSFTSWQQLLLPGQALQITFGIFGCLKTNTKCHACYCLFVFVPAGMPALTNKGSCPNHRNPCDNIPLLKGFPCSLPIGPHQTYLILKHDWKATIRLLQLC